MCLHMTPSIQTHQEGKQTMMKMADSSNKEVAGTVKLCSERTAPGWMLLRKLVDPASRTFGTSNFQAQHLMHMTHVKSIMSFVSGDT